MKTFIVYKVGYIPTKLGKIQLKEEPKVNQIIKIGNTRWGVIGWQGRKLFVQWEKDSV